MKQGIIFLSALAMVACNKSSDFAAMGTFEATTITVSAESTGKIEAFSVIEGGEVKANSPVGIIDTIQLGLQRQQLERQFVAIVGSKPNVQKQVKTIREQIAKQEKERTRVQNLLHDGAATQKQLDDIESAIAVLNSQLESTLSTLAGSTTSIEENANAVRLQIAQVSDKIKKCQISSPISGTVLVKYAEAGEFVAPGKPLMKVADLSKMYLRVYYTSEQLADVRIGDTVTVVADFGANAQREYSGIISWIAAESEFTPKSIQTKESRANLVYAAKISVANDGYLKIGLSGYVK